MLQLRNIFFGRALLRERPGQHELGFENRPSGFDYSVEGCGQIADNWMLNPPLDPAKGVTGVAFEPVAVEGFGHDPELDDEIAGQVLWLDLAALLAPKAEKGTFIIARNDPSVRAADEALEWAQAIINEICALLAEINFEVDHELALFHSSMAVSDDLFKSQLALEERLDAMIDRAVKRLIQTKAMKQMLGQTSTERLDEQKNRSNQTSKG